MRQRLFLLILPSFLPFFLSLFLCLCFFSFVYLCWESVLLFRCVFFSFLSSFLPFLFIFSFPVGRFSFSSFGPCSISFLFHFSLFLFSFPWADFLGVNFLGCFFPPFSSCFVSVFFLFPLDSFLGVAIFGVCSSLKWGLLFHFFSFFLSFFFFPFGVSWGGYFFYRNLFRLRCPL